MKRKNEVYTESNESNLGLILFSILLVIIAAALISGILWGALT